MMKTKHISVYICLFLLCACSNENDELPGGGDNTPSAALRIEVSASDFTPAGTRSDACNNTATRATDSGSATTFENGDRIGITVLDDNGTVLSSNIPYIYNGSNWFFDSNNGEGKTAVYYDNKAGSLTYFAYFPYSKEADGIAGADILAALKAKFPPLPDQRTKDAYRSSDLLVWSSGTSSAPLEKLDIAFTHAYALLSFSPFIKCKIQGKDANHIPSPIDDVGCTAGNDLYWAYQASDGSLRIIVSPQRTDAHWLYSYRAEMYEGAMPATDLAENNRYALASTLDIGDYTLDKAHVGDFYCKNARNEGYLIPGEFPLTEAQKAVCLGIVMKAGRGTDEGKTGGDDPAAGNWLDDADYYWKDGSTPLPVIHGYVLALWDANGGKNHNWGPEHYGAIVDNPDWSKYILFRGYKNTREMKEQIAKEPDKALIRDFTAAYYTSVDYERRSPSPANSSGWFLPSSGQCWYWYQNRNAIKPSMDKAGGDGWFNFYWASSERGRDAEAWSVSFSGGYMYGSNKEQRYGYPLRSRSWLAF